MAILTTDALNFARAHIENFYDSDFFPKSIEFAALWHHWDKVLAELTSKNVGKIWVTLPRVMAVPKPRIGYRVVHQLEPVDALVYTALAAEVTDQVEVARIPADLKVACSYRFLKADGSFFAGGNGWMDFVDKTEQLSQKYAFVLTTDITDFYNQVGLHRLNNAIEHADAGLKSWADDIEKLITVINGKVSQGVPVGPAASIVM